MKWQGRQRSSNIEDRRGAAPGGDGRIGGGFGMPGGGRVRIPMGRAGGGIGGLIGIVVILGIIWVATGVNPIDMLSGGGSTTAPSTSSQSRPLPQAGQDELADFVGVVVKETENLWTGVFRQNSMTYRPPTVVLFTQATQSGCGVAQAATGPFYCPEDKKVYIDLGFYDQLRRQFGAPGDVAQAYVIAHEIGHAVQDQTGILPEFQRARPGLSETQANAWSVRVELQADCYAGVWANYAGQENLLETGDFEEAMNAANQIGDDVLTRGTVSPRKFTHGTSVQRRTWFQRGYQAGDPGQCDTFAPGAV